MQRSAVKQQADKNWQQFIDTLNGTFADAYADLMALCGGEANVRSVELEQVAWPVDGQIQVLLGAHLRHGDEASNA